MKHWLNAFGFASVVYGAYTAAQQGVAFRKNQSNREQANNKTDSSLSNNDIGFQQNCRVNTNIGNKIDITPSKNHLTTTKNPGYKGAKNLSIDIIDEKEVVITCRWFDDDGKAIRDVDMTNHGNPRNHPEWPHVHLWKYGSDGKPIGR